MKRYRLSLFLLLGTIANSQDVSTINGFIREAETGEPIAYANVFIKDSNLGSASNIDGYYVITNVPAGKAEIVVSIIGYKMVTQEIDAQLNKNLRLNFRLDRTVLEGETVDVFGEAQKMRQLVEPSRITIDLRTMETAPAFVEPDLFRIVQMLPGVQTLNDFSSALYVRGSTPDQNLILLDGITIYNPYHLGGIFSTFNTDAIKEADFHAGGFPARYGGRMGAILHVINREGNTEEFQGNVNISLISSKALIEGPLPNYMGIKGSWMIAGRRTYFDQIINALMGAEGDKSGFKFPYYFYDYQIKVNLDLNPDHRLT
ncbi:MAG TPA: carboxypeptidase-like regulatory domain-containing protein, partial [Candidatus Marinimicrobia bacterium]|nr:carboxypeptidase-like regulatory domain-containing protein [Candidatus Neomarinimicrobiota bacterium]